MHVRVITFNNTPDVEVAVAHLRDKVIPVITEQKGFRGVTASADRSSRVFGVLSLWDTAADREASFEGLTSVRTEAIGIVGDDPQVETFEEMVVQVGATPPSPGAALMITRVRMEPARIDENVAFFRTEVAPRIAATAGFRGLRNMINRDTGQGVVGTVWSDRAALDAAAADARARRREIGEARGITFTEEAPREVVFVRMN